jgi:UTP--glucose-1-phosphate uridylyltransferase
VNITKAVITAAGRAQRTLPLQSVIDRDGAQKSVLRIIIEEALQAGTEEICVVLCPGDEQPYARAAGDLAGRLHFVVQREPLGYGHAVLCARDFVGNQPFLHLVGDHLYVGNAPGGCARRLVEIATDEACAVSAVQPSRESQLPYFGTIGGRLVPGRSDLYAIERVVEKPTPTLAEQELVVPGLRVGHYLCFFGIHVLTPTVMDILAAQCEAAPPGTSIHLSPALDELARHERYLALSNLGRRYDVGVKYGLLTAQLALALEGSDREEVLAALVELLALRSSKI